MGKLNIHTTQSARIIWNNDSNKPKITSPHFLHPMGAQYYQNVWITLQRDNVILKRGGYIFTTSAKRYKYNILGNIGLWNPYNIDVALSKTLTLAVLQYCCNLDLYRLKDIVVTLHKHDIQNVDETLDTRSKILSFSAATTLSFTVVTSWICLFWKTSSQRCTRKRYTKQCRNIKQNVATTLSFNIAATWICIILRTSTRTRCTRTFYKTLMKR